MSKIDLYKGDCFYAIEVIARDIGMPKTRLKKEYLCLIDKRHKITKHSLIAIMLFGSPRAAKRKLNKNTKRRMKELEKALSPFVKVKPIKTFSDTLANAKKDFEDAVVEKGLFDE